MHLIRRQQIAKLNLLSMQAQEQFQPYNYFDFKVIAHYPAQKTQKELTSKSSSNRQLPNINPSHKENLKRLLYSLENNEPKQIVPKNPLQKKAITKPCITHCSEQTSLHQYTMLYRKAFRPRTHSSQNRIPFTNKDEQAIQKKIKSKLLQKKRERNVFENLSNFLKQTNTKEHKEIKKKLSRNNGTNIIKTSLNYLLS